MAQPVAVKKAWSFVIRSLQTHQGMPSPRGGSSLLPQQRFVALTTGTVHASLQAFLPRKLSKGIINQDTSPERQIADASWIGWWRMGGRVVWVGMDFDLAKTSTHDIYNLLIGLVVPRPIALVTTLDLEGRMNAAPFSAYNYLTTDPPIVAIGVQNRPGRPLVGKDTAVNIRNGGEFVVNVVNESLAEAMNICAIDFPPGVDELETAGLRTAPSTWVKVPRIASAPAALECREFQTTEIGNSRIVLGRVVGIHVADEYIDPAGPYVLAEKLHAIGRMNGGGNYVRTRDAFFQMKRLTLTDWNKSASGPQR